MKSRKHQTHAHMRGGELRELVFFGVAFLDVADLSRALCCSRETVLRIIRRHKMHTIRRRHDYLVLRDAWQRVVLQGVPLDANAEERTGQRRLRQRSKSNVFNVIQ